MSSVQAVHVTFNAALSQQHIPSQFIWPDQDKPDPNPPEFQIPVMDLAGFLSGDPDATAEAARIVDEACRKHGFFAVVNHGVDGNLVAAAHDGVNRFFTLPVDVKEKAQRKFGKSWGYAGSFVGRFADRLPWKETFSLPYVDSNGRSVEDYFHNTLGQDFMQMGKLFQEYCNAMSKLSLSIMELLEIGLGVNRAHFKEFFTGNESIIRLNYYPQCKAPSQTLGTGPHADPTSLTILHEDLIGGLQVFVDGQWQSVTPNWDAFIVNIGDTFTALSNGVYISGLHRAIVNSESPRKSLAFFLCPNKDRVVRPPEELIGPNDERVCPDFTWPEFLEFTQKYYRSDTMNTLHDFAKWIQQTPNSEI